jgi:hypothetical protein
MPLAQLLACAGFCQLLLQLLPEWLDHVLQGTSEHPSSGYTADLGSSEVYYCLGHQGKVSCGCALVNYKFDVVVKLNSILAACHTH